MKTRVLAPSFVVTEELKARFFSKTIGSSSGCIIWTGAVQRHGYGAFKIQPRKIDAHVASWRIANGGVPVPLGFLVMHSCDCRMCVNSEHLMIGTASENGLQAHMNSRGDDFKSQGEDHYRAVISESIVREIRRLYQPRTFSAQKVADHLGISRNIVKDVISGKSWKSVAPDIAESRR